MIKAIIFDVDGTLADTVMLHVKSFQLACSEIGLDVPKEEILARLGIPAEIVLERVFEKLSFNFDVAKTAKRKKEFFLELVKGKELLFPDAKKTILFLKKNFKLALFTGADRTQLAFLGNFLENFEFIVAGKECIKPKPFPDSLWLIAKKLGVLPQECVFVGDMPVDMIAGKSAGMFAIGIENNIASKEKLLNAGAYKVVKNLNDLLKLKELQK